MEGPNGRYEVGREPPEWEFGTDYDATDETEEGSNDGSNGSDDEQES